MNIKRKTLKGFTLVELLIVMALFSIIMTLVLSFVDPVSKLMNKTSVKERTAAYSDNIAEYVENSLRYASHLYIYEGGYPGSEAEAVLELVNQNFDGACDQNGTAITGKARVMKFLNEENGKIQESMYSWTAGNTCPDVSDRAIADDTATNPYYSNAVVTADTSYQDVDVINPEFFRYYNYYYTFGNDQLISTTKDLTSIKYENSDTPPKKERVYTDITYSYKDADGNLQTKDVESPSTSSVDFRMFQDYSYSYITSRTGMPETSVTNFPINILAYTNERRGPFSRLSATNNLDGGDVALFKNPCHMDTTTMALVNANAGDKFMTYYRQDYKVESGNIVENIDNGKKIFNMIPGNSQFRSIKKTTGANENIYVVYVLPYEVNNTLVG